MLNSDRMEKKKRRRKKRNSEVQLIIQKLSEAKYMVIFKKIMR
jgi:hypothetical protein